MALQASTYTHLQIRDTIQGSIKLAPLTSTASDSGYRYLDTAMARIWKSFPWSWAQATTTIAITTGTAQDLSASAITNNLKLLRARLTRTDTTPDDDNDLIVKVFNAPTSLTTGWKGIESVAYNRITDQFRFDKQLETPSDITLVLEVDYHKVHTKITSADGAVVIQIPDIHANVFIEGARYYAYLHADDPRAGGTQTNREGAAVYTGQYAIFMNELNEMLAFEDQGEETIYPSVPIGVADMGRGGLFG